MLLKNLKDWWETKVDKNGINFLRRRRKGNYHYWVQKNRLIEKLIRMIITKLQSNQVKQQVQNKVEEEVELIVVLRKVTPNLLSKLNLRNKTPTKINKRIK